MATIITKNSSTASAVPSAGSLVQGELAVNVTDKKLYTKDAGGTVQKLVGSLGNQEANNVTITGGTITGMSAPSVSSGVANKGYVDGLITTNQGYADAAAASAVLANDWATKVSGPVAGGEYSAKYNAQQASSSASAAASSASAASTSASNASTSASNAAAAQTAAEAARDATLTAYDNFDDRYLGTKTSDPTVDNDGNPLVAGTLYYNSVSQVMRLYTGSAWVAAYVSGADYLAKANNLSDLTNVATARTNLSLGNVDNTSDATKNSATATLTNKTLTSPVITQNVQVISTNTTAVASRTYVFTASLTLTLPATPTAGDWVKVVNSSGTTTPVIDRNGSNIMSLAENMTIDKGDGASFQLTYADATRGWVLSL